MKQRIDVKQLAELTHEQKIKLYSVWNPQKGDHYSWYESKGAVNKESHVVDFNDNGQFEDLEAEIFALPLVSIGQMIEIIQDLKPIKSISKARFEKWIVNIETSTLGYKDELCDTLWEAVTRIL